MSIRVTFIEPTGSSHDLHVEEGTTAMEAAVRGGVPGIPADCGGACACATCHVIVDSIWFDKMQPMSAAEDELLDLAEDRQPNSRLSCQIVMGSDLDGIVMQVPLLDR